jgi:purine-binding chemotaxis protein CheW
MSKIYSETSTANHSNMSSIIDVQKREFLVFGLNNEEYAIDIGTVNELRGYGTVTSIANSPIHIKGVINLRGAIVPIIDLRIKFGQQEPSYDQFTVAIILTVNGQTAGMVVDSVSNVVALSSDQLKPAPKMSSGEEAEFITGIGTVDDRMLILIDVEKLIFTSEISALDRLAA